MRGGLPFAANLLLERRRALYGGTGEGMGCNRVPIYVTGGGVLREQVQCVRRSGGRSPAAEVAERSERETDLRSRVDMIIAAEKSQKLLGLLPSSLLPPQTLAMDTAKTVCATTSFANFAANSVRTPRESGARALARAPARSLAIMV